MSVILSALIFLQKIRLRIPRVLKTAENAMANFGAAKQARAERFCYADAEPWSAELVAKRGGAVETGAGRAKRGPRRAERRASRSNNAARNGEHPLSRIVKAERQAEPWSAELGAAEPWSAELVARRSRATTQRGMASIAPT
jgi:hypothetical protein